MYKLAPFADNFDMWIALSFCYLPSLIFFYLGWRASKSGSMIKVKDQNSNNIKWIASNENVPILKTGFFQFGLVWVLLGSIFFWVALWPDHHDVWFIITDK